MCTNKVPQATIYKRSYGDSLYFYNVYVFQLSINLYKGCPAILK